MAADGLIFTPSCLDFLRHLGFNQVGIPTISKSFGDMFIVFENQDLRIRIVKDRGKTSIDLAAPSEPNKWWDSSLVGEMLNADDGDALPNSVWRSLDDECEFLRINYLVIAELFNAKQIHQTMDNLERLGKSRAERILNVHIP